jgi:DNA-binding CsgD family transcriptional regulator
MDSTRLVGRDPELALLREQLDRARAGEARIVFVRGEAGIGKTSLVRHALSASAADAVVAVSGEQAERDVAYGVVDQLMAGLGAPAASGAGPTPVAVGAALLRALSDRQVTRPPLVLWIDDLQWADASSQQAVVFALRRLRADAVCAVLCSRDDEPPQLPGLARLRSDRRAVVIDMPGLEVPHLAELAELAGVRLARAAAQRLHAHTRGNPLWIHTLLRDLDGAHLQDLRHALPAPKDLTDLVAARLARLSREARSLVEVAAVASTDWPLGALAAVADVGEPHGPMAEGIAADLLLEAGTRPTRVRPPHALIAAAVVAGIGVARRAAIHARLATTATREHERLHHEVAASPGNDDGLSRRVEQVGREQLSEGSWATAATTLSTAAHLTADPARRADLAEEALTMALLAGDVTQAGLLSRELATRPERPRSLSLLGWYSLATGQVREAEGLLRRSIVGADPAVESQSRMILAQLLIFLGRAHEAVGEARRASALAAPGTPGAAHARGLLVVAMATAGDHAGALAAAGDVDAAEGDPTEFPVLVARGSALVMSADYAPAAAELELVASRTDRLGMLQFSCVLHAHAARALYVLGDWSSAIDHGERGVAAAEDAELAWAFSPTHATVAQVYARMGTWSLAEHHVRAAEAATNRLSDPMSITYAGTARAVLAHARQDPEGVLAAAAPIRAMTDRDGTDEPGLLDWPVVVVESLLALGLCTEATEVLREFSRHAHRVQQPFPNAEAARLRAEVDLARGRPGEALAHCDEAVDLASAAGAPYEMALATLAQGRALNRLGRVTEGSTAVRRAADGFARLGALPAIEQATRLLDGHGSRSSHPRPSPRDPGLTPQEIAVSRLVRKGLSNREIASELFLSTKTVEFHLSHVFLKLGITSRTQLVARSADLLELRPVEDGGDRPLRAVQDE